ncbi:MAG TPA: hypothetical protein VK586_03645 [Streptosporangiaceae bacterium]|nr:hypothetical protein [Streptosporangiaceae bacterium]
MILAATLAAVVLLSAAAGIAWSARLIHVGHLDAQALAGKLAVPHPVSALDWPELAVRAVIPQPDERPLVLLRVAWPAHPQLEATLLIALATEDHRSLALLSQWWMTGASVSPVRREGAGLELRRGQSLERVHAVLIAEDVAPGLRQGRERHS